MPLKKGEVTTPYFEAPTCFLNEAPRASRARRFFICTWHWTSATQHSLPASSDVEKNGWPLRRKPENMLLNRATGKYARLKANGAVRSTNTVEKVSVRYDTARKPDCRKVKVRFTTR